MTPRSATTATSGKARIIVVDDHPILCEGLAQRINRESDMVVCGAAESPQTAMQTIRALKPDCALVDISLREGDGIELVKDLQAQYPKLAILVLSMHDESLYAERALRAGAKGYIMKREKPEEVIKAIRAVLSGQSYLSNRMTTNLLSRFGETKNSSNVYAVENLSDRELQIYQLIGRGVRTREIGELLHLSVKTIASHRENIKHKLNVKSGSELVRHAVHWCQTQKID